jgi:hypothetical protein
MSYKYINYSNYTNKDTVKLTLVKLLVRRNGKGIARRKERPGFLVTLLSDRRITTVLST